MRTERHMCYGKSMYGGWYGTCRTEEFDGEATFFNEEHLHANTKKALFEAATAYFKNETFTIVRYDNI